MKVNSAVQRSLRIPRLSFGALLCGGLIAFAGLDSTLAHADELKVLDNSGNTFLVVDAPRGATFSVEAFTSFTGEGRGLVFLKNEDESFSASNVVEKKNEQTAVLFEGVESGVYTISSSSPSITISKVDAVASTQAHAKSSPVMDDDTSVISKSAYAVGAAAVAGGVALGISNSSSSGSASAASGSVINASRSGGTLAEVVGSEGVRNVGSQQVVISNFPNPIFDQGRPTSVTVNPTPTPFPPSAAAPNPSPTPEAPATQPQANPTPLPAPPVTQPMTLN